MLQCAVWQNCADVSECLAASIIRVKSRCLVVHGRFWSLPTSAGSVQSTALRLTAVFGSTYLHEEDQWTTFTSAQVLMNPLPVSYHKISNAMYQLCNRTVNEKHLLIMVNCFSLNRSIFNKQKNCTVICLMLLCYFKFPFLVDQILIHYALWYIAKRFSFL